MGFFPKKKFVELHFIVHVNSSFILVGLIHLTFGAQDDSQGVQGCSNIQTLKNGSKREK